MPQGRGRTAVGERFHRLQRQVADEHAELVLSTGVGRVPWAASHLALSLLGTIAVLAAGGVHALTVLDAVPLGIEEPSIELRPRSIHSGDRCNFDGSERLRLTQRVMHVGGPYNALSQELNPELMSVITGPQDHCPRERCRLLRDRCAPNRPPD
jgi:hypothetical protein